MIAALLVLAAAAPPARSAVALVPLRSLGVPGDTTHALQEMLRNELSALPEARIVSEKDLQAALQREPECESNIPCAAAAAARAGARLLIMGTASQLGDAFMIDLKLLDARTADEIRRATHPVSGTQDALIQTLREAAVELLAPERFTGSLRIDVPGVAGALLFVDGKQAGKTPLEKPIDGLKPGAHTLRVTDGHTREVSSFVDVRFGQTTEARIELGPEKVRTLPAAAMPTVQGGQRKDWTRPAALGGLGLGVASAMVAVAFHAHAYATAAELNRRAALNQLATTDTASYSSIDRDVSVARWLYATAAVLAAAGGGLLWWDLHEAKP